MGALFERFLACNSLEINLVGIQNLLKGMSMVLDWVPWLQKPLGEVSFCIYSYSLHQMVVLSELFCNECAVGARGVLVATDWSANLIGCQFFFPTANDFGGSTWNFVLFPFQFAK